jgi:WbqC-like protein family
MDYKIAILQSNYIPWKGYFDIINSVDEFVIYDDVQYTKGDWRNRNIIATRQGLKWLTIPVKTKGRLQLNINEIRVSDKNWKNKHWKTLQQNYGKAPYFSIYKELFADLYFQCSEDFLSNINYKFITAINNILGISTPLKWSIEYNACGNPSERLIDICKKAGASTYLSGLSAKAYLDTSLFTKEGVCVEWVDYKGYPEYTQLHAPFEHGVTVLDLIFNEGPNAKKFMKTFGQAK